MALFPSKMITVLGALLCISRFGDASSLSEGRPLDRGDTLSSLTARQAPGNVPATQFYRRGYHASAVVGNWLYIDGGEFSYLSGDSMRFEYATSTLSIDLSRSWTNSSVTINSIPKPSGCPNLIGGSLWYNEAQNELLQGFAGAASAWPNSTWAYDLSLWSLKPDSKGSGTWTELLDPRSPALASITRPLSGLMAYGRDAAYVLGGLSTAHTSPDMAGRGSIPLPGLITYNMTTKQFTNTTAKPYYGNGTAERGQMVYVPTYGEKGLFMMLGGDISPLDGYTPGSGLRDFANITIYDPATQNWYFQRTTGEVPKERIEFCATGTNSPNGTYEIFVYGGWNSNLGEVAIPYDEVFILTLPAFHWMKVRYPPKSPRHGHSCHIVGNRQMVIIGGVDTTQSEGIGTGENALDRATFNTPDPFTNGIGIFDISTLNFVSGYDSRAAPYEQSDVVSQFYQHNSRYPSSWDSPAVQALIRPPSSTATPTSDPTSNTSTSTSSSSSSASPEAKTKTPAASIAGGVVGGLAGLALIGGAIAYLVTRRRRAKRTSETQAPPAYHAGDYNEIKPTESLSVHRFYHELTPEGEPPGELGSDGQRFELNSGGRVTQLYERAELSA